MKFTPLGHRILVRQLRLNESDPMYKKSSMILIPDTDDRKREQNGVDTGEVLAIGPTAFKDFGGDWDVHVGDIVSFARYAGKILKDPEQPEVQFVCLNDEDLVAKVEQ
jgi:co-chaperonin GroES (HSP10)